ncbi:MAG: exodeoxyribonuclease VII large subunit [Clostridiales bacterium]|nr:exodeoxyribonuclease VII large subunit [Clostridiales bacterium]
MKGRIYSIAQLNRYVKRLFEKDAFLSDVFVEGEISNLTIHRSGHIYLSLKDSDAQISCVMFSTYALGLKFLPETGMKVTVYGQVSLYEKTGAYQLYIKIMEPAGLGALYAAFERLKNKLEKEGIFDPSHKKEIPQYVKTIAVLTSPTGAAVRDIISISKRRNPNVEIVVCPVLVQGEKAADSIVKAIADVNRWKGCDLIILGRGGGSIEDLWAFNEEKVAYAIYDSKIPVISAVGHETDFTIADFAADLRAPTPSAAAELALRCADDDLRRALKAYKTIEANILSRLNSAEADFNRLAKFFSSDRFLREVCDREGYVSDLADDIYKSFMRRLELCESRLSRSVSLIESLSPLKVVSRGYCLVTDKKDRAVSRVSELKEGDRVKLSLKDGRASAEIKEICKGDI